jgi:ribosomal protein S18 acetylase RimI-like enzyme
MEREARRGEAVVVRNLRPGDLEAVIALDARIVGRRRDEYFRVKLQQSLAETGIKVSLAAEREGLFCGFLLARVYYGEFGTMEPVAVLDTLGVHPGFRGLGVGAALIRQLRVNLSGLGVSKLRTEAGWDDFHLLGFFHHQGFRPASRFCLDLDLTVLPREEEEPS